MRKGYASREAWEREDQRLMMGLPAGISANVQTHCVVDPLTAFIMDESCSAQAEYRRPGIQLISVVLYDHDSTHIKST